MAQGLGEVARRLMENHGGLPESFHDFYFKTAVPERHDYLDLNTLKRLSNRKERLGAMLPLLSILCWQGIGFGVTYPDHVEKMWKANYETVDHPKWQQARAAG